MITVNLKVENLYLSEADEATSIELTLIDSPRSRTFRFQGLDRDLTASELDFLYEIMQKKSYLFYDEYMTPNEIADGVREGLQKALKR